MLRYLPLIAGWCFAVVASLVLMNRYDATPSAAGTPPVVWPSETSLGDDLAVGERAILLMFIHPKCPCTRASLAEVGRLMNECDGRLDAVFVLVKPPGVKSGWENTDLRTTAQRIPGTTIHIDEDGRLARHFHAVTSGETLLYDQLGQLRFHGGMTASRGHQGQNAGRSFIVSEVVDNSRKVAASHSSMPDRFGDPPVPTTVFETPVFGCELLNSTLSDNQGL